ncbi:hypothetical protein O0L34_g14387 [Tuta absoluta]|nr:hypothetical protein O0L34_g14387 [Tuta absoluta]
MSPRLVENTKWLWCLLVLYPGSWSPVGAITVKSPPNTPSTVEAQAKFFQYRHLPTHEDFHQGHRQGSERHFTERHERSRPSEGLYSAKVRWGDKQGGYGEHYWDLNHAGHADSHGDDGDDGSYRANDHEDPYDEPSEQQSTYNDDYDPEQAAKYEDTNRAKRHHKLKAEVEDVKTLRRRVKDENNRKIQVPESNRDIQVSENKRKRQEKEEYQEYKPAKLRDANKEREVSVDSEREYQNFKSAKLRYKPKEVNYEEEDQQNPSSPTREQQQQIALQNQQQNRFTTQPEQPESTSRPYVPYEGGAGVRQHQPAEVTAASAPRLFLEPSTGHVVDRATGQAYVLQPIANYQ